MDILNAMTDTGFNVEHIEEVNAVKDYDRPFMLSLKELENGVRLSHEEVERLYDWHNNLCMAIPAWLSIVLKK